MKKNVNPVGIYNEPVLLFIPVSSHWYYAVTPPLLNLCRNTSGKSAARPDWCLGWSEHMDCAYLRPSEASDKCHHGPNPYYTLPPLEMYFMKSFMGRENFHHWLSQAALPTKPHPRPGLEFFEIHYLLCHILHFCHLHTFLQGPITE